MSHEYQIALDPALLLSPADFLAVWNASPDAQAAGHLRPDAATPKNFLPPEAVTLLLQTAVPTHHLAKLDERGQNGRSPPPSANNEQITVNNERGTAVPTPPPG